MVFVLFGQRRDLRPVEGGRRGSTWCSSCRQVSEFRECSLDRTFTAYVVLDLFTQSSTVFACSRCGSTVDRLDDKTQDRAASPGAEEKRRDQEGMRSSQARKNAAVDRSKARREFVEDELNALRAKIGLNTRKPGDRS